MRGASRPFPVLLPPPPFAQISQWVHLVLSVSAEGGLAETLGQSPGARVVALGPLQPCARAQLVRDELALYGKRLEESPFNNQVGRGPRAAPLLTSNGARGGAAAPDVTGGPCLGGAGPTSGEQGWQGRGGKEPGRWHWVGAGQGLGGRRLLLVLRPLHRQMRLLLVKQGSSLPLYLRLVTNHLRLYALHEQVGCGDASWFALP